MQLDWSKSNTRAGAVGVGLTALSLVLFAIGALATNKVFVVIPTIVGVVCIAFAILILSITIVEWIEEGD